MADNIIIRIKNGTVSKVYIDQNYSPDRVIVLNEDIEKGTEIKQFNVNGEKFHASVSNTEANTGILNDINTVWSFILQSKK